MRNIRLVPYKQLFGCLAVFGSAFCFYLSTVAIRWASPHVSLAPSFFVFARLFLGFIVICAVLLISGKKLAPRRYHFLIGRTISNLASVYFFYKAVTLTSVAEANILNMTYPLFVALFSWVLLKEERDLTSVGIVLLAFAGIWLILSPENLSMSLNNLWGLASGFTAAFAVIYLNLSCKYHDTETILFYMFGLGSVMIYLVFYKEIFFPNFLEFYYLSISGLLGIGGQYLFTLGFQYVTAVEGGIISSTRILLAALLGPFLVSDPPLTATGWTGAVLIFLANIYMAMRKAR